MVCLRGRCSPGGIAAVPLNAHTTTRSDPHGTPRCDAGLRMHPTYQCAHTYSYTAQRYRCPLLIPQAIGELRPHEQFLKGHGCPKDINDEPAGRTRILIDRTGPRHLRATHRLRADQQPGQRTGHRAPQSAQPSIRCQSQYPDLFGRQCVCSSTSKNDQPGASLHHSVATFRFTHFICARPSGSNGPRSQVSDERQGEMPFLGYRRSGSEQLA